jgi:dienelactone hydrolase
MRRSGSSVGLRTGRAVSGAVVACLAVASAVATTTAASASSAALPDHQPPVPTGNPYTAFSKNGPYKPGVVFETTPEGDTVVVTYPVDPASTVGKATYVINLLRWYTGSPTAPIPTGLPKNLPVTLATDAYTGVPISSGGPFPVVLFAHGGGGYPEQSSFLTDHLATWGFVVVAPDVKDSDLHSFLSSSAADAGSTYPIDLSQALSFVGTMNGTPGTLLAGKLDLSRVATLGHSDGGAAAINFAVHKDIRTYVALAPAGANPPPSKPGMIMQGAADKVVNPAGTKKLYARLAAPKRLILVDKAGHNVFDDGCTIGAAHGGLVAFVKQLKLPHGLLAEAVDGCSAPDVYPPKAWPMIDQAVTAQLRWGLGIDKAPIGLGSGLDRAYAGVTVSVQSQG